VPTPVGEQTAASGSEVRRAVSRRLWPPQRWSDRRRPTDAGIAPWGQAEQAGRVGRHQCAEPPASPPVWNGPGGRRRRLDCSRAEFTRSRACHRASSQPARAGLRRSVPFGVGARRAAGILAAMVVLHATGTGCRRSSLLPHPGRDPGEHDGPRARWLPIRRLLEARTPAGGSVPCRRGLVCPGRLVFRMRRRDSHPAFIPGVVGPTRRPGRNDSESHLGPSRPGSALARSAADAPGDDAGDDHRGDGDCGEPGDDHLRQDLSFDRGDFLF
jgi:hypothetical protein